MRSRWLWLREFYLNYWHARTFGKPVRESLAYAWERMRCTERLS